MDKKIIFIQYIIAMIIILIPLTIIGGGFGAIHNSALAQLFPASSSCAHINCIFLLSDITIYRLFLLTICAAICIIYFIKTMVSTRHLDSSIGQQHVLLFFAFYAIYIQVLRAILSFSFLRYDLQWWMPLISRIAIFGLALHACIFFIISLWMIESKTNNKMTFVIFGLIISFAISYLIPIDRHLLTEQLIHKTGYFQQLRVFIIAMNIITIINYLKHYIESGSKRTLWLQAGYVLHAFSMHALFIPSTVQIVIIATLTLCVATGCIIRYTHA